MKKKHEAEINSEIDRLHKKKTEAMNKGDRATYQNCCNQLAGISYVMSRVK
jgi:hypothetical protein